MPYQGVKAGCRLLEHQQIWLLHEGQGNGDFLPVALRQLTDQPVGHLCEQIQQAPYETVIDAAPAAGEPVDVLTASQPWMQLEIAGQVGDTAVNCDPAGHGIEPCLHSPPGYL